MVLVGHPCDGYAGFCKDYMQVCGRVLSALFGQRQTDLLLLS